MIFYLKEDVELLHMIKEHHKGVPITKVFEFEAKNYKYGKEEYFNVIKKQIDDTFEFTAQYASIELNIGLDEYVGRYCLDPETISELIALNDLQKYLQSEQNSNVCELEKRRTPGKPATEVKEAAFYLHNPQILQYLIDNYTNVEPQIFNHLILVLRNLDQLKPATQKEIKEAFCKELKIEQTQSNFNKAMRKDPNITLFNTIKNKINPLI